MHISILFESWRLIHGSNPNGWGLAWFLANELCQRYYSSHGIVPHVICKEGLGYYGIQFDKVRCPINKDYADSFGRVTLDGDVENWRTGGPGDHGLKTTTMCAKGLPTDHIVRETIRHMGIPSMPETTHLNCRHKRWGKSYELLFEIATIFALRNDQTDGVQIWNHLYNTERLIKELDPKARMKEHLGAFLFQQNGGEYQKVIVTSDGRLLGKKEDNYWHRFMGGESAWTIALEIEEMFRPDRPSRTRRDRGEV